MAKPSDSRQPAVSPDAPDAPPPARRRTRRRWPLVLLVVLGGGALWLNGPGIRWLGAIGIRKGLAAARLDGSFRLEGTIAGGLELRDVSLHGEGTVREFHARLLAPDYRLGELVRGRLRGIRAEAPSVVIELAAGGGEPADDGEPQPPKTPAQVVEQVAQGLRKAHGIADPLGIDIEGLAVDLRRNGAPVFRLEPSRIEHRGTGKPFSIGLGRITDAAGRTLPPQEIDLEWDAARLLLPLLAPAPGWTIREFELTPGPGAEQVARAVVGFAEQRLTLVLGSRADRLDLELGQGPLQLSETVKTFGIELPVDLSVERLLVSLSELNQPFEQWSGSLAAECSAARYDEWVVDRARVDATLDDLALALRWEVDAYDGRTTGTASTRWPAAPTVFEQPVPGQVEGTLRVDGLAELLDTLAPRFSVPATGAPFPGRSLDATWRLALSDGQPSTAVAELRLAGENVEAIDLAAGWSRAEGSTATVQTAGLQAEGSLDDRNNGYTGRLALAAGGLDTLRPWIARFTDALPAELAAQLDWQGSGSIEPADHRGQLDVGSARWAPAGQPPVEARATARYRLPLEALELDLGDCTVTRDGKVLTLTAAADRKRLRIPQLALDDGGTRLVDGSASVPLPEDIADWRQLLALEQPWQVDLKTETLSLDRIGEVLAADRPLPVRGNARVTLKLAGTPNQPTLESEVIGIDLETDNEAIPPTGLELQLATREETLVLSGRVLPRDRQPITIDGRLPLRIDEWIGQPESFLDAPFEARATVPAIRLEPFLEYVPALDSLTGWLAAAIEVTGTARDPKLSGTASLRDFEAVPRDERISPLRKGSVELRLDDRVVELTRLGAQLAGGTLDGTGRVDLADLGNPSFDLVIEGRAVPLWRESGIIARADASLRLAGALDDALLSGRVGMVQSLFFRDFELIPIGVPFTAPSAPTLPQIDPPRPKTAGGPLVPAPFGNWRLDLALATDDPFLVRGNLATGAITADVKVGGTLNAPQTRGSIDILEFEADLPLSRLRINEGKVVFRPEAPFDPSLEIRGRSTVAPYDVSVFVYGTVSAPKYTLSSNPPLPESEIMTLLATGATSSGLEKSDSATNRLLLLLIEEARRGRLRFSKQLLPVLELFKNVDLRVGQTDPYTGRDYNSATLRISDNWLATFAIDELNQTRSMLMFVMRFR